MESKKLFQRVRNKALRQRHEVGRLVQVLTWWVRQWTAKAALFTNFSGQKSQFNSLCSRSSYQSSYKCRTNVSSILANNQGIMSLFVVDYIFTSTVMLIIMRILWGCTFSSPSLSISARCESRLRWSLRWRRRFCRFANLNIFVFHFCFTAMEYFQT